MGVGFHAFRPNRASIGECDESKYKKAGACRKTVAIEVPAELIAEERAETLKVYAKHARIPGFRKGKLPRMWSLENMSKRLIKI